ncbi:cytochrome o ubiquinol oxidase subunit 1 [Kerstersia gyiorum]|uniref:cytochrome o ubiquinol oxidase subunit I n=1 Tax=Kerstersia gyiorum TaxID=206506 RepID=UPI0020A1AC48|nr:cytochrome o ubiquinol oxidase subunit I [Kerstersia gyiorum]MCP1712165.1 cytochrome o ubiquinol oxidase subunit 1 [Kerstersia gyiorum]
MLENISPNAIPTDPIFGKLTLNAIPHDPIALSAAAGAAAGVVALVLLVTFLGRWKWLWKEWFTSVDHKKIGIMYILVALVMLIRGFADAIMMRSQLAVATGDNEGYLHPEHYDQIFTAHGVIMIFFMAMPFMTGLMNIIVPLQIGARDVAFPLLNSLSFWLFVVGVALVNVSLGIGEFATTGWLAYPPLSGIEMSPGVGVDYYIWSLQISGLGTLLTGVNFIVTILKMRAPGMDMMKMPVFTWTVLCSSILIVAAFPVLTATLAMLSLDRYLGMHFFTNDMGGNPMMYVNLIWIWGHPEVYILVLPAFGIFSEVVSTFSGKRLFGYKSMVYATMAIAFLSFIVWVHHFFTMGAGANVNAFFGIMTMLISIPTGVKIFNWVFTMYGGRIRFSVPIMWTLGFLITFAIGGMTGVLMSVPAADFVVHNSLFLIAHFHNTIIGGVVFGYIAGFAYWFPKATGFKLNEFWGKGAFWGWLIGFYVAFMPLYILGFMGMTRRMNTTNYEPWVPFLWVAFAGAGIVLLGIACQFIQVIVSVFQRKKLADVSGDPWDGRTLEWATSSPPPFYNFAVLPYVDDLEPVLKAKEEGTFRQRPAKYEDIHMPRNTGVGLIISLFLLAMGFGLVWHIWWMAIVGFVGGIVTFIVRSYDDDIDYWVPAAEVERIENEYYQRLKQQAA